MKNEKYALHVRSYIYQMQELMKKFTTNEADDFFSSKSFKNVSATIASVNFFSGASSRPTTSVDLPFALGSFLSTRRQYASQCAETSLTGTGRRAKSKTGQQHTGKCITIRKHEFCHFQQIRLKIFAVCMFLAKKHLAVAISSLLPWMSTPQRTERERERFKNGWLQKNFIHRIQIFHAFQQFDIFRTETGFDLIDRAVNYTVVQAQHLCLRWDFITIHNFFCHYSIVKIRWWIQLIFFFSGGLNCFRHDLCLQVQIQLQKEFLKIVVSAKVFNWSQNTVDDIAGS